MLPNKLQELFNPAYAEYNFLKKKKKRKETKKRQGSKKVTRTW